MEIFIQNLDSQTTDHDLTSSIASLLALDSIQVFHVHKTRKKGCAVLTIANFSQAKHVLARYEKSPYASCFRVMNKAIRLSISRNSPDQRLLRSLNEENNRLLRQQSNNKHNKPSLIKTSVPKNLGFQTLFCGRWEVHNSTLQYVVYGSYEARGTIRVDRWSLNLALEGSNNSRTTYDVLMDFNHIRSIAINPKSSQTYVTITLGVAPKIYGRETNPMPAQDINGLMRMLKASLEDDEDLKYRSRELGSLS